MKKLSLFFLCAFCFSLIGLKAQTNVEKRAEQDATRHINNDIDKTIDNSLNKIEGGIKGLLKKKKPTGEQPPKQAQDGVVGAKGQTSPQDVKPASAPSSLQAFSNYDFVPGDKVLLYEDFSQDAVGDFPALWTTNKSGEVNTLSIAPGNWLNLNATEGNWWLLKQIDFPKNFIVEFDVVPKKGGARYAVGLAIYGENGFKEMSDPYASQTGLIINVAKTAWESYGIKAGNPKINGNSTLNPVEEEKVNHVIVWVQNRRVRIYHKGEKVLDMPTNLYADSKFTRL